MKKVWISTGAGCGMGVDFAKAALPVMRKQRSCHNIAISSGAGLIGFEFHSAYAAARFGLESWMESLTPEVTPFGISTIIINPGMFRTELLTEQSASYAEPSIANYAAPRAAQRGGYEAQNGDRLVTRPSSRRHSP